MKNVSYAEWDSTFFNYKIGKTIFNDNIEEILNEVEKENYDLIYVFSDKDIVSENKNLTLVDKKVLYETNIHTDEAHLTNEVESYQGELTSELLNLTFESGFYSRFKLDLVLNNQFNKLYETWINKSLTREIANEVFVMKSNGKIIAFVTLKIADSVGQIGLIAVNKLFQNKGIGKKLIANVKKYCQINGLKTLQVATQLNNKQACVFYEKNGFDIKSTTKIYHLWNL